MTWLRNRRLFSLRTVGADIMSGVTLGVESVPDAMAAGVLAGINPVNALYAVLVATPVGALFASSVFMSVQTTSAMSLLVASVPQVHTGEDAAGALFMLSILTGMIMLVLGLFKLGSLLRFVPKSVMTGFINGVAVLIILGQLDDFTGYSSDGANKVVKAFDLLLHIDQVDIHTLAVGLCTVFLILVVNVTRLKKLSMVVAIVLASLLVPLFSWESVALVSSVGAIPSSLPLPALPSLSALPGLLIPALSLAFVGLVQGAGISQTYPNPDGKYPDPSGDFVGQGAANIAAGVFQGMPVGGSVSATALGKSGGAQTRFANIFVGVTMAVSILLLGESIGNLAMPALAGLLMVVGFQTLKPRQAEAMWKTGPVQAAAMVVTFAATLLIPLQYAVVLGVGLAVLLLVVRQSNKVVVKEWVLRPGQLPVELPSPEVLAAHKATVLVPHGNLFFAAAATFEGQLPKITTESQGGVLVLNLRSRTELGISFMTVLRRYSDDLKDVGGRTILAEVDEEVMIQLRRTEYVGVFGRENIFVATQVVGEALADAYDAAEEWLEKEKRVP